MLGIRMRGKYDDADSLRGDVAAVLVELTSAGDHAGALSGVRSVAGDAAGGSYREAGMAKLNLAPCPGSEATSMNPRCSSTSFLTMKRPSPLPPYWSVRGFA